MSALCSSEAASSEAQTSEDRNISTRKDEGSGKGSLTGGIINNIIDFFTITLISCGWHGRKSLFPQGNGQRDFSGLWKITGRTNQGA